MQTTHLVAAVMLLATAQARAEDIRIDCLPDQRIVCRNDEATCRPPKSGSTSTYHFTFDLKKKTGSLLFCSNTCQEPSPLIIVHDSCTFLHDYGMGCLQGGISVWESEHQQAYTITHTRYITTIALILPDHSTGIIEYGRCAIQ